MLDKNIKEKNYQQQQQNIIKDQKNQNDQNTESINTLIETLQKKEKESVAKLEKKKTLLNIDNSNKNENLNEQPKHKLERTDSKTKKKIDINLASTSNELTKEKNNNQLLEIFDNNKNKQKIFIKDDKEIKFLDSNRNTLLNDMPTTEEIFNSAVSKNVKAEELLQKCNILNEKNFEQQQIKSILAQKILTKDKLAFNETMVILPHQNLNEKPPLPEQSQDEKLLNDKVECIRINHESINEKIKIIRQNHEKRVNKQLKNSNLQNHKNIVNIKNKNEKEKEEYKEKIKKKIKNEKYNIDNESKTKIEENENKKKEEKNEKEKIEENEEENREKKIAINENSNLLNTNINDTKNFLYEKRKRLSECKNQKRFKILYRSASSRPIDKELLKYKIETKKFNQKVNNVDQNNNNKESIITQNNEEISFPIPISFYFNNSCSNQDTISNMQQLSRSTSNVSEILKPSNNNNDIPLLLQNIKDSFATKLNDLFITPKTKAQLKNDETNYKFDRKKNFIENNQKFNTTTFTSRSRYSKSVESYYSKTKLTKSSTNENLFTTSLNRNASTESKNYKKQDLRDKLAKKYSFSITEEHLNNYTNKKKPKCVIGHRGSKIGEMNWLTLKILTFFKFFLFKFYIKLI